MTPLFPPWTFLLLLLCACAPPPKSAPYFLDLEALRLTGIALRPVRPGARARASVTPPGIARAAQVKPGPVPKVLAEKTLPELSSLGTRIGQRPSMGLGCVLVGALADSAAGGFLESCLGAALPSPLSEALVTEQVNRSTNQIVAVIAEESQDGQGSLQARYDGLAARLKRVYGQPREPEPGRLTLKAGAYSIILELGNGLTNRLTLEVRLS